MGFFDTLQESNDKTWSLDAGSYNPMQSNVLGNPLTPTTPQGDLAAVDPSTDSRTPEQFKQDARTATAITSDLKDDSNSYKSRSGNAYDKFDNSSLQQGLTVAAQYMSAYFATGGNVGKAAFSAGQSLADMDAKEKRYGKIDELEDAGHNPLDIQKWLDSGDDKDLVVNKGSWTSGGNGTMFNTLTGEVKAIPGAVNTNAPVKTVDLGDRKVLYYADGRQETVAKGANPTQSSLAVAGASGGGIGIDSDESTSQPAFIKDASGGLLKLSGYNKDGTPRYTAANSKDIETYNAGQTAATPDANQQLVSSDLTTVEGATPEQLNRITGPLTGRSETVRDVRSSLDPETRKIYQASQRLTTQMGNAAISAAKSAGASGINTEAEIKRFTQGVPQVDYTSTENYNASIQKIKDYAENFRAQLIAGKTGKAPESQNAKPKLSDDELLNKYLK